MLSRYFYKIGKTIFVYSVLTFICCLTMFIAYIYVKIDDKTILSSSLSAKGINFVGQLFQNNQQIKKWNELKTEFDLIEDEKFLIAQMSHALPSSWKEILRN